jgi:thiamine-phosphate pyrophosphorylase
MPPVPPTLSSLILDVGPEHLGALDAVLANRRPAAVILRGAGMIERGELRSTIERIQAAGAAALLADDLGLAATIRADGAHVTRPLVPDADLLDAYRAARARLGVTANIGVEVATRHDAMVVGEAGADYVAFGPAVGGAEGRDELVAWWSALFEVPCVALGVASEDEARRLTLAGADFIALAPQ